MKEAKTVMLYYPYQGRDGWAIASIPATKKASTYLLADRILAFNFRAVVPNVDACLSPTEAIGRAQNRARQQALELKAKLEYLEGMIVELEALR